MRAVNQETGEEIPVEPRSGGGDGEHRGDRGGRRPQRRDRHRAAQ
jgi:hypothetical protein